MLFSKFASAAVLAMSATLSIVGTANAQGDRDCPDFSSQAEAQTFFESAPDDVHRLDADNDNIACENLPAPSRVPEPQQTEVPDSSVGGVESPVGTVEPPVGGIATGDGSADDDSGALPLLLGLVVLSAASATTIVVTRHGRRSS